LLGAGVNNGVFSLQNVEDGTRIQLNSIPKLGSGSGPESFVTRLGAVHVLSENTTLVADFTYFQSGYVEMRDAEGNELGIFTPSETAVRVGVVQQFTESLKGGVKLGYANTNLGSSAQTAQIKENALTADFSLDYAKELGGGELVAYWALNNIGKKNTFSENNLNYLPTQLHVGAGFKKEISDVVSIAPSLTLQKYLVPTPPVIDASGNIISGQAQSTSLFGAMFGAFNDAPGGFSEEMQEMRTLVGLEALLKDKIVLAVSASLENVDKGNRQFINFGLGYNTGKLSVGAGYYLTIAQEAAYYNGATSLHLGYSL
jgi:hypothetical protein